MQGLMMEVPLLISSLIRHADRYHGDAEIVSRTIEGPMHRYTYRDAHVRARRLARALARLGVAPSDRVGTLAWNGYRHFELYFAVSGMGAITHTINPRLFRDQLTYIVEHAEDKIVFFDLTFSALVEQLDKRQGADLTRETLLDFYDGKIAQWWMPDDVVFVDELPHTAAGKLSKRMLRERFRDYRLPTG